MRKTYRTPKTQEVYEAQMKKMHKETGCRMCTVAKQSRKTIGSFKVAPNQFPYDRISEVNDMLILKRHKVQPTKTQMLELFKIFEKLGKKGYYNHAMLNFSSRASIPGHWHIHIFRFKK